MFDRVSKHNVVTISGDAKVRAEIDIATLTATVVTRAETYATAQAEATERTQAIFSAIESAGVSKRDYQSTQRLLEWRETVTTGEGRDKVSTLVNKGKEIITTISCSIRKLDKLADLLTAIGNAGASTISDPQYSTTKMSQLLDSARTGAMADVIRKVGIYAKAAGFKVISLKTMAERTIVVGEDEYLGKTAIYNNNPSINAAAAGVGTNQLGLTVTCEFEISPLRKSTRKTASKRGRRSTLFR